MKAFLQRFRNRFFTNDRGRSEPPVDIAAQVEAVRRVEESQDIDLGKRIHSFQYQRLELRLDRDMMGLYRVTVNEGKDRRYSFTVMCTPGDYDALHAAYEEITHFLDGDRRLTELPRHDRLKSHFYGR